MLFLMKSFDFLALFSNISSEMDSQFVELDRHG